MPVPNGYSVATIDDLPEEAELAAGGVRTRADGTVVVSTRHGEIWELDPDSGEWTNLTNALSNALGVWIDDDTGDVYSGTMPALVRVGDDDGDGLGDDYTIVSDEWGWTGNYHEFVFGPVRDSEGNFYLNLNLSYQNGGNIKGSGMGYSSPWRGWMVKITPDGELIPFANGFRSPSGIGINADDELFYTDNQGDYVPVCHLSHVEEGNFYGHPASLAGLDEWTIDELNDTSNEVFDEMRTPPAAWIPYSQSNATAGLTFDEGGNFGPFEGQIFAGCQGQSKVLRFALEEVGGQYQGAVFNFATSLQSGTLREAFSPDGQSMWLGQTSRGWGSVGSAQYGMQRIDYDGETIPFEMHSISVQASGFEIEFTKPIEGTAAADPSNYDISHWTYDNNQGYGSSRIDETSVDSSEMSATVSDDGMSVELTLPSIYITPSSMDGVVGGTRLYGISIDGVQSEDGEALEHPNAWYTVNRLPEGAVGLTYETSKAGDGLVEVTGTVSNPSGAELTGGSLSLTTDDDALSVTPTSETSFNSVAAGGQYSAEWVVSVPDSTDHELALSASFTQSGEQYDQSTTVTLSDIEALQIPYAMDTGGAHTDETVTIDGLEFDPSPEESQAIDITGNRQLNPDEIWWPDQVEASPNPNSYGRVADIDEVANTEHDLLYKTEHWAPGELGYTFTVDNGTYDVTLHFSELVSPANPPRVFSVDVQGETVIEDLDLVEEAGGTDTALVYTFENVEVTDNELTIQATSSAENPKFSGIEIREGDGQVESELLSAPYGMDAGGAHTDETVTIDGLEFDPTPEESQAIDISGNRKLEPSEFWWPGSVSVSPIPNSYGGGLETDISNTELDTLYQTEHWADGELTYDFSIENGVYDVTLHLAEVSQSTEDARVFSAMVNGETLFESYDIVADVGANTAVTKTIEGVAVTDEELLVELTSSVENPKVSGVEIREGQADLELESSEDGWVGVVPSDIEGATNPTLSLTAGEEYSLQWTNGSGELNNFEIMDGDGSEIVSSDYSDEGGETQILVFTATTAMDTYRSSTDSATLQGDIEVALPEPETVTPGGVGVGASPPSNGTVLWNGEEKTLENWQTTGGGPAEWTDEGDYFEVNYGTGDIVTDEAFGDCHLHLEWRAPTDVAGDGQSRANSGVFMMDRYEFQVLDTYQNPTYADGQAGAYYSQAPPLANPARPPGEWQAYDIIWRGPRFTDDGSVVRPAQATVLLNGVVVQAHLDIEGPNTAGGIGDYSPHPPEQPLRLQDHNDLSPPEFRNIWYQPLPEDLNTGEFDDLPTYDTSSGDSLVGVVEPGATGSGLTDPPADAKTLLGSDGLAGWEGVDGSAPGWSEEDGYVEVVPGSGDIQTTTKLGDSQIHLEWRIPESVSGDDIDRGNSGALMMGRYQIQILDNDGNPVDPVQWAGSYPEQAPPLYDPAKAQGEWQTLDIIWQGPRFDDDGSLSGPARVTVLLNETVVQARLIANGPNPDGTVDGYQSHPAEAPLRLEENGDPVQFRNVWSRPLHPSGNENAEPISAPYGMDTGGAHTDETVTIDGLEFDPSPEESQAIDINSNRQLSASEIWWPDAITATPNPNSDALGAGSEIANTDLDSLYQTEHWAEDELTYDIAIENGTYDVTLHLAEVVIGSAGSRVFSGAINGETVFEDYDIYDDVGANTAVTKTIKGVEVTNQELLVELNSSVENPKISGIEIRESSDTGGIPDAVLDPNTTIEFEAQSNNAWTGVAPSAIEGENPTLTLADGETYTVEWTNGNGVSHNFVVEDANGNTLVETEFLATQGESQTVEFTAESDLATYYCLPHRGLGMEGNIEIV